jgi:Tol biopolymer transport system component
VRLRISVVTAVTLLSAGCGLTWSPPDPLAPPGVLNCAGWLQVKVVYPGGAAESWHHPTGRIAFQALSPDNYFHLYLANEELAGVRGLTVEPVPGLPSRNHGIPFWHPSGRYIAFNAEKQDHPGDSTPALPGLGVYVDLWVMRDDASAVFQLTDLPADGEHGVISGEFSPDGSKIAWAEMTAPSSVTEPDRQFGFWALRVADFADGPDGPRVENIRTFEPGGPAFHELADWSPDGAQLLFTGSQTTHNPWLSQIFILDLASGEATPLTSAGYNEHAVFAPDGQHIVWMSGAETTSGTDWWVMRQDGSEKRRLTYLAEPASPQWQGGRSTVTRANAWSADGSWFYGDAQPNLLTQSVEIVKVTCP